MSSNWVEPKTRAEANELKIALTQEIADIDAQIRARKAEMSAQRFWPQEKWAEYQAWLARATTAKQYRQQSLTRLRHWMSTHNPSQDEHANLQAVDPTNPNELLTLAFNIIRSLGKRFEYKYTPEEDAIVKMIGSYLDNL